MRIVPGRRWKKSWPVLVVYVVDGRGEIQQSDKSINVLSDKVCFGGYVQFVPLHSIILKFLLVPKEDVRLVALFRAQDAFAKTSPMLQRKPHAP